MQVALINGSPKAKDSASGVLLGYLATLLEQDTELVNVHLDSELPDLEKLQLILGSDVAVWAFPLYVDGIPSHLIPNLVQLERICRKNSATPIVYALVNCGFYEAEQAGMALRIMKNWATRAGVKWGRGYGLGAGGMFGALKNLPLGRGLLKNLGRELHVLAAEIRERKGGPDSFVTPNFPRLAYKLVVELNWRRWVMANGLKIKDLGRKVGFDQEHPAPGAKG